MADVIQNKTVPKKVIDSGIEKESYNYLLWLLTLEQVVEIHRNAIHDMRPANG